MAYIRCLCQVKKNSTMMSQLDLSPWYNVLIILLIIAALACGGGIDVKPMKYTRDGIVFSCNAYYHNGSLLKIVCLDGGRDTSLIELYKNDLRDGQCILYYPGHKVKEIGQFSKGKKIDIWKEYFENGSLRAYEFYKVINDTSYLYYQKSYNIKGDLVSMILPIDYRTNSDGIYKVGQTYQLYIDLAYSQYDSVKVLGFLDSSLSSNLKADTSLFEGKSLYFEFKPLVVGKHRITGKLFELDAKDTILDDYKIAEKPFRFDYIAIE